LDFRKSASYRIIKKFGKFAGGRIKVRFEPTRLCKKRQNMFKQ